MWYESCYACSFFVHLLVFTTTYSHSCNWVLDEVTYKSYHLSSHGYRSSNLIWTQLCNRKSTLHFPLIECNKKCLQIKKFLIVDTSFFLYILVIFIKVNRNLIESTRIAFFKFWEQHLWLFFYLLINKKKELNEWMNRYINK